MGPVTFGPTGGQGTEPAIGAMDADPTAAGAKARFRQTGVMVMEEESVVAFPAHGQMSPTE